MRRKFNSHIYYMELHIVSESSLANSFFGILPLENKTCGIIKGNCDDMLAIMITKSPQIKQAAFAVVVYKIDNNFFLRCLLQTKSYSKTSRVPYTAHKLISQLSWRSCSIHGLQQVRQLLEN